MRSGWIASGLLSVLVGGSAAIASAYEVAAVSNGGVISGKITFKGAVPEASIFNVEKTPEVCGEERRHLIEVAVNSGHLKGAVITLEGIEKGKPYAANVWKGDPPGEGTFTVKAGSDFTGLEVSPKKCNFGPVIGVVQKGKPMDFVNRDPVKHSPHTYEVKGRVRKTIHNQDLEGDGKLTLSVDLEKSRVFRLECDQHNFMQNMFYAVENPYYALSAADGSFTIDQIPPGSYKLTAWHPKLGLKEQEITVAAGGKLNVNFEFSAE